jgi:hypothetical protein
MKLSGLQASFSVLQETNLSKRSGLSNLAVAGQYHESHPVR